MEDITTPLADRPRVIFTIVSANYISLAASLMQSVRRHHPHVARYIILADARQEFFGIDLAATILNCQDLGIERLPNMMFWYSVMEFNTAIKPYVFRYFMRRFGFDDLCYLDPDILVFAPLQHIFAALTDHSVVLTPHMMVPLQDGKEPSDLTIMKSGVYNLGFLAVRNNADARGLIDWWADRCYDSCRVDIAGHLFTDQRWMDLAPVLVKHPYILRHPGYNVAYWNLPHRKVTHRGGDQWTVNGKKLMFFHFSGIKIDDPTQFSKHQNRYTIDNVGDVARLCHDYRQQVIANQWEKTAKIPYGFAYFANGRKIDDRMRQYVSRAIDAGEVDPAVDLDLSPDYFDAPEPSLVARGIFITRFMYQLWLGRPDLRAAFTLGDPAGAKSFCQWFVDHGVPDPGILPDDKQAALRVIKGVLPQDPAAGTTSDPPWPSLSREAWRGPAADVGEFLRGTATLDYDGFILKIPVAATLLWERRPDLQKHFPLHSADNAKAFFQWVLISGLREGSLRADDLGPDFIAFFTAPVTHGVPMGDVPITRGMMLITPPNTGTVRDLWKYFPLEKIGRLALGVWVATMAPGQYQWPAAMIDAQRRYFWQDSDERIDGYPLNRAIMTLYEMRPDLQIKYPLTQPQEKWRFLRWLCFHGLREYQIRLADLDPNLRDFLHGPSPRLPGITQIEEMLWDMRPDLQEKFPLDSEADRRKYIDWCAKSAREIWDKNDLAPLADSSAIAKTYRCRVVLSGIYTAMSGRGEDVRGSDAAFQAVGFKDYIIADIVEGVMYEPSGDRLPHGTSVTARYNIVHMNADTAERDWRRLQAMRIVADRTIGFWAWELDRLPSYWRHSFSYYDEIWASTDFAQAAFAHEDLRPVRKMPMTVAAPAAQSRWSRAGFGLPEDETIFFFMFDFKSYVARKNPEAAITAFRRAFADKSEKVRLLIKTQGADDAEAQMHALRVLADSDPRIEFRDARLPRDEVVGLLTVTDIFVSLHRSEGFGRGPAEAMLLGKPVIVTNYSGGTDFATADCALLVDYLLVPVEPGEYPGVEGQVWADADIDQAAGHMRWAAANPAEAQALGQRARARILSLYAPDLVGAAMLQACP